jgi:hypothetical protein
MKVLVIPADAALCVHLDLGSGPPRAEDIELIAAVVEAAGAGQRPTPLALRRDARELDTPADTGGQWLTPRMRDEKRRLTPLAWRLRCGPP